MRENMGWKLVATILLSVALALPAAAAQGPDYQIWAGLLKLHVSGGVVDYEGFQADESELNRFLQSMAQVHIASLDRNAQMALYINAYNAWTIKLILSKYPDIKSIKDLGGIFTTPWQKEFVRLGGQVMTLDDIEHNILRPRFRDPRVHFAVNCASKSCPPLLTRPYLPQHLDEQLNQVTSAFVNDPKQTFIKDRVLHLSSIFKWFAEDFNDDPAKFILVYAKGGLKNELEDIYPGAKIIYLDYDWSLNGK